MASSRSPPTHRAHNAPDFDSSRADAITVAPMHNEPLDLDQFMMDNNSQIQHASVHTTPPQVDISIGHPQFATNFSYSYQNLLKNGHQVKAMLGSSPDPYNLNFTTPVQPAHRSSIPSNIAVGPRSLSSGVGEKQKRSVSDGSPGGSPPNILSGEGPDIGYSDEFGLNNGSVVDGSDLGSRAREEKYDTNPPWSELKTKAGKERKRLPLACIACRRKKIRCSGEKPACKHCLRSRIPCVYKVTTRKAAPRTDYMAMLDKRLKRMEDRIIKIVPREPLGSAATIIRAAVKPVILGPPARNLSNKKRPADEAFGAGLDSWSRAAPASQTDLGTKPSSLVIQEAEESRLLSEGAEALPSKEIQEHLSEVFFENIYGQAYHVLHKPSFMRKLRNGTIPPVLILAVCAVSARFSTHPKLNSTPNFLRGEEWASEARNIVTRRYDWPNITILTCLLILGLHEFGTCQGGRSWSLGGMAVRMAYALQLHRDLDYDPLKRNSTTELSFIDREIRRRTMWACFLMDRFNSSGTDRPSFIKEDSIKVQLPIKEKLFQLDMPGPTEDLAGGIPHPVSPGAGQLSNARENMGVAAYMIRSIALWGKIISYLNLGGKEQDAHPMWHPESKSVDLIKQTEMLTYSLPESLQYTPENLHTHETEGLANQFLFLHITIQQCILFMNRFAVPGHAGSRPPPDAPKDFVTRSGVKAFEAANWISELLKDAESYLVTAPFAGYCAFLSSTVHIFGNFSKNPAIEASSKRHLATNVKYLSKMKKYWGMFHFMSENLKEQYRTCADAAKQGSSGSNPTQSSNIFQYGDWFDRYPHGVSHPDFEDPASGTKKEKGEDAVLGQRSNLHTVEEFFTTLSPPKAQESERSRPAKRKTKKPPANRQEQPERVNTDAPSMSQVAAAQMHNHANIIQNFNSMSPTTPVDIYSQTAYYGNNSVIPQQQGILPQLDRQLVFGAYAGMDPSSLGPQSMLDGAINWDMQISGMPGYVTEPSSAWFIPFNMEPPEIGPEMDFFNAGSQYGIGGMHINNNDGSNRGRPRRG